MLRRFLLLTLLLSLAGCASDPISQAKDNWRAKDFSIPPKESLVILLPPVAPEFKELLKGDDMLLAQLGKQLELAGYKAALLNRENYNSLWSKASAAVGGIFDPVSGARRPQAYAQAMTHLAQHVCQEAGCALLIQPRIALRSAELHGSSATWDGQRTRIPTVNNMGRDPSFQGGARAISVELTALTSKGAFAFRTYGGASLIYAMDMERHRGDLRRDLFSNDREIATGVRIALAPLTP